MRVLSGASPGRCRISPLPNLPGADECREELVPFAWHGARDICRFLAMSSDLALPRRGALQLRCSVVARRWLPWKRVPLGMAARLWVPGVAPSTMLLCTSCLSQPKSGLGQRWIRLRARRAAWGYGASLVSREGWA